MNFKSFKKKKKKVKEIIRIHQSNQKIEIEGKLNYPYSHVKQLLFVSRSAERTFSFDVDKIKSNTFRTSLDLTKHSQLLDYSDIYDLFLSVYMYKDELSQELVSKMEDKSELKITQNGIEYYEHKIRLGRFQQSEIERLDPIHINNKDVCIFFKTIKGNISFSVNQELKPSTSTQINNLKFDKSTLLLKGKLFTRNSIIEKCQVVLKSRERNSEIVQPVIYEHLKEETEKKFALNRYLFKVNIDLKQIFKHESFEGDIFDIYLEFNYHDIDEKVRVRLGRPRFRARFNLRSTFAPNEWGDIFSISPYYTIKYKNLSFQVDKFTVETYKYLRKMLRWNSILRPFYRKRDIWVVGERPYKAQDTGYHFFKYMRESHPERNVFYVIEKNSPEYKNVKELGNILEYKSKEHIFHVLMGTRVIGSHHPDYIYPLRTDEFKKKVKAIKVFLQHGVIGTKNVVHFYGKQSKSFYTDLFLVSSDFEKQIIINDFGYLPSEVKVTGLSRFDRLLEKDTPVKRQLLIIPTWREWLVNDDLFLESEYFQRYKSLINNRRLQLIAKQNGLEIIFCLHPNMQKFTHFFEKGSVKIISQGEVDVQDLLKESSIMITDYSSVAFDFSFLHKPILYYQFDRDRYIGKQGSHLDLDADLPGDIIYEEDEIIQHVIDYAQQDFKMTHENKLKADKFLKYRDGHSSERIFRAVESAVKKPFIDRVIEGEIYSALYKRLRKSKYYFPLMKLFYKIAKRLVKVDQDLILFESGLGKQYSDSPRYIYEEILKRKLPYKKVWVYNGTRRFKDIDTIYIRRLSPKYYYYLAKARYWVNNQNFPTYIKKRSGTTYLQTWHGTPLKKMLYDINEVHGRSDDYVERVGAAVKDWDYLLSPSEYATKAFKTAFRYEGEVLELGYPRNDIFYSPNVEDMKQNVLSRLNIMQNKKVILYAPTFRDDQPKIKNRFSFDLNMDLAQMKEKLGDDYVILLRMHVVVSGKLALDEEIRDFAFNVSNYPDIQELMLISDVLITDYSSVMFDFANTNKPMLFFTYDFEHYRDDLRGFYMDLEEEAPGPLVFNTEEIIKSIEQIDKIKLDYQEKYKRFQEKYCPNEDGEAAERVVDYLFER